MDMCRTCARCCHASRVPLVICSHSGLFGSTLLFVLLQNTGRVELSISSVAIRFYSDIYESSYTEKWYLESL